MPLLPCWACLMEAITAEQGTLKPFISSNAASVLPFSFYLSFSFFPLWNIKKQYQHIALIKEASVAPALAFESRVNKCNMWQVWQMLLSWKGEQDSHSGASTGRKMWRKEWKGHPLCHSGKVISSAFCISMQQRGGFCSGSHQKGALRLFPPWCGTQSCGQLSEASLALQRWPGALMDSVLYNWWRSSPEPALIRLDKAPLWAELLLCTSSQPLEICRAKCVALCRLSLLPPHAAKAGTVPQGQAWLWEGAAAQLSSPWLCCCLLLQASQKHKSGALQHLLCATKLSAKAVNRAAKLHWSSRQKKRRKLCMCVLFVHLFFSISIPTLNWSGMLGTKQRWPGKRQKFVRRCITLAGRVSLHMRALKGDILTCS